MEALFAYLFGSGFFYPALGILVCISNALNLGYYSIMAPPRGFFQGLVIDIVVFFQALVIGIVIGFSYDMDLLTYFGFLEEDFAP